MSTRQEMAKGEARRLEEDARRLKNWKRWGPYLSERQWATVREDYSPDGKLWESFPYEHSLARAYRWGEDGLLGMTDRECRLCFALALWNGKDPHLKERLFGLTNPEGNHSEDVKEVYFYLDATPTYSYFKALYKYPQAEFPYRALREESRRRGRREPEFELTDAGVFDGDRYWDVTAEYAKASPDDILIRVGQRVGVGWHAWHCGSCDACRRGDFFACQTGVQVTGISFDGGYADYMIAPPTVSGLVRWRWAHPPSQDAARKWKPGWAREARGQQEQTAQVSLPGWLTPAKRVTPFP